MKLSEILGWPLKAHEEDHPEHCLCGCRAWNICLSECDREIDRDALENVLLNMIVDFISEESMESADKIHGYKDRIIDSFISTMPTWLKRVEK